MYYHILIESKEKIGKNNTHREITEVDRVNEEEIITDIVIPFIKNDEFRVNGFILKKENIQRLKITTTEKSARELADLENNNRNSGIIFFTTPQDIVKYEEYNRDITNIIIKKAEKLIDSSLNEEPKIKMQSKKNKVFVVHGHDCNAKIKVARFVEKLQLEAVILHEQVSKGNTIIEKIEENSDVGFCIVLYTPCDIGYCRNDENNKSKRARQNVVFEHGYMIAKLGRNNVCALIKEEIEKPNDISGLVYIPMDENDGWQIPLAKEMKSAGCNIDFNLIM